MRRHKRAEKVRALAKISHLRRYTSTPSQPQHNLYVAPVSSDLDHLTALVAGIYDVFLSDYLSALLVVSVSSRYFIDAAEPRFS